MMILTKTPRSDGKRLRGTTLRIMSYRRNKIVNELWNSQNQDQMGVKEEFISPRTYRPDRDYAQRR